MLITESALLDGYHHLGRACQNVSMLDGLPVYWAYTADTPPNEHIVDSRDAADNVRVEYPRMRLLPLATTLTPTQSDAHARIQKHLYDICHAPHA